MRLKEKTMSSVIDKLDGLVQALYDGPKEVVLTLADGEKVVATQWTPPEAKTKPEDPAYWMLNDGIETTPEVYSESCYICRDSEFAQMGLPLCRKCAYCGGHIPADNTICDVCGGCDRTFYETTYQFLRLTEILIYPDVMVIT